MDHLREILETSQARHTHLCPRQVLGVRIALAGLSLLNIDPATQRRKKQLMVISETDGCFVDGIEVTAQVSVGYRTLKIEDYGKIAATFVDVRSGQAVRLHPAIEARELARSHFPEESRAYFAQLKAYQTMPDHQLLRMKRIALNGDLREILGSPRQRAFCIRCGEEVINGREVIHDGLTTCKACAGNAYYREDETAGVLNFRAEKISFL